MNMLKNTVCYMIGAIEKANDLGTNWRKELKEKTKQLGIIWIDPTDKPRNILPELGEVGNEHKKLLDFRSAKQYDEVTGLMKKIRRVDLRFCDLSDFVVFNLDPSVPTFGSLDEVYTVEDQHKPILVICKGGKEKLPLWLFAVVNHTEVFENVDELCAYLVYLDTQDLTQDKRWVLIRADLK